MSFYFLPDPQLTLDGKYLNQTLGGYLNKILSFWLMKRPMDFLAYIIRKRDLVESLFNHLYLTQCVTDILVRLCTIPKINGTPQLISDYQILRTEIIQICINSIESHSENDFMTE